jgi:hypothetical protein
MARYKTLRSVVNSLAASFASVMNFAGDDYVMCHLIRRAKVKGTSRLQLNLLARSVGPLEMLTKPILQSCESYCNDFGGLVMRNGSALDMVSAAALEVRVVHGRPIPPTPRQLHARVTVTVTLTDDRGRTYRGRATEAYVTHAPR